MDKTFIEPWRFWSKVERVESGCMEWQGAITNGYSNTWNYLYPMGGVQRIQGHRLAYMLAHGEIPEGMQIDHLCRNKICVNVEHLEAVTQAENVRRHHAAKTHCKSGHEYTEENTHITPRGGRQCRACNRRNVYAFYERVGTTNPYKRKPKKVAQSP